MPSPSHGRDMVITRRKRWPASPGHPVGAEVRALV